MHTIQRVLVGLDLTSIDQSILSFMSSMSNRNDIEKIYFVHVAESLDIPEEILKSYPDLLAPTDETIRREIEQSIEKYLKLDHPIEYEILICEGNISEQLLIQARRKNVDLMILGRKPENEANLYIIKKIVRVTLCSIALIPVNSEVPDKILVPVDFSENCASAIKYATNLMHKGANLSLYGIHIYTIPSGYSRTGKSYEELKKIMRNNVEKQAMSFFMKNNIKNESIQMYYELVQDKVASTIYSYAHKINARGIIMASKGRAGLASIVLGSVAERMLDFDQDIPLLILKDRIENMGLFDALAKL